MSDALYVLVDETDAPSEDEGKQCPWVRADVVFNGEVVATGWCPVRGEYKSDGIARKTAISLAIGFFTRPIGKDVRDASATAVSE